MVSILIFTSPAKNNLQSINKTNMFNLANEDMFLFHFSNRSIIQEGENRQCLELDHWYNKIHSSFQTKFLFT